MKPFFVFFVRLAAVASLLILALFPVTAGAQSEPHSLDGTWRIMADPKNQGKESQWWTKELLGAKEAQVPGILQASFRDYHGVVWFDREFKTPRNPNVGGRYLLRFWQAEYYCEVWVNEKFVGCHEGGEASFEFDVTDALAPEGDPNRVVVRLIYPGETPIDGFTLTEIPRRNNTPVITPGCGYASGGLVDSVEIITVPAVRIADLHLIPDWKTGEIAVRATMENFGAETVSGKIAIAAAPATGGEWTEPVKAEAAIPAGKSIVEGKIVVPDFKLWELNDPNLYLVALDWTGNDAEGNPGGREKRVARTGFRDFRFENGYFRLNGKRIYLKCSHSGSDSPIFHRLPLDPDFYRRDILLGKGMGFNMIRYISGMPRRFQLDLCDELGFMVYDECLAGWMLGDSPLRTERWTRQTEGMILRDRNHPSVVIWGLLNETFHVPSVIDAVRFLPRLRKLDPDRVVILNSGNFDCFVGHEAKTANYSIWRRSLNPIMPAVIANRTDTEIVFDGSVWPAGKLVALHPGDSGGEYSVLKWTAPEDGDYSVTLRFADWVRDGRATVDLHLIHGRDTVYEGNLNLGNEEKTAEFSGTVSVKKGEELAVIVGIGDGSGVGDTTGIDFVVTGPDGMVYDAAADFKPDQNPNGVWTYGFLPTAPTPNLDFFALFDLGQERLFAEPIGHLANPGSVDWQNVVDDTHPYRPVPHTAAVIDELRTHAPRQMPTFLSEYGIGSGVDLFRLTRLFEGYHGTDAEDAVYYRAKLDRFMTDWNVWRLDEVFSSPEDFFQETLAVMADQRRYGINAIRSNPNVIGHSVTGTHDQGISGEGLTTIFRELKPGTFETMADLFAKLRFCLFVEPVQLYPGRTATFEAVLVNEDVLPPGDYPVRLQVVGPPRQTEPRATVEGENTVTGENAASEEGENAALGKDVAGNESVNPRVYFDQTVSLTVPNPGQGAENPFVLPVFKQEITLQSAPEGEYRFLASFQQGGAAAGGSVRFFVTSPTTPRSVSSADSNSNEDSSSRETESVGKTASVEDRSSAVESPTWIVWGGDADLLDKLRTLGYTATPLSAMDRETALTPDSLIVVGGNVDRRSEEDFARLYEAVEAGARILFLSPNVFGDETNPLARLPFTNKGERIDGPNWLYHKDDWNRVHPIFAGLPAGHVMDSLYYRNVIPQFTLAGLPAPDEAVAGAFNTTFGYSAGISIGVWKKGEGVVILNSFKIQENLLNDPVADRLLINLLDYLAAKGK